MYAEWDLWSGCTAQLSARCKRNGRISIISLSESFARRRTLMGYQPCFRIDLSAFLKYP